jgi:hypothetical protein
MSGVTGGIEAGYNWQIDRKWLLGIEADFNGSNLRGNGNSTSMLEGPPAVVFTQTVATQQNIDWYGTLRGRIGWLPTSSLLLFGTGGFAYGQVANTGTYSNNGPFAAPNAIGVGGVSVYLHQQRVGLLCWRIDASPHGLYTGWWCRMARFAQLEPQDRISICQSRQRAAAADSNCRVHSRRHSVIVQRQFRPRRFPCRARRRELSLLSVCPGRN